VPWWLWLATGFVAVWAARALLNRRVSAQLGVKADAAMLARAQEFMARMIETDKLITSGEVGQAMLLLDELAKRPELAEMPALAAQVHLNLARVTSILGRHDDALAHGAEAVAFHRRVLGRSRGASNASNLGEALQIVAQAHLRKGDTASAITAFQEIQAVSRRGAFRQTVVRTEIELARLHLEIDDFAQAHQHAAKGHELARKWKMADHAVEALNFQALATALSGDIAEGRRLLDVSDSFLRPDAPLAVRAHGLVFRATMAAAEEDLPTQVSVGGELLGVIAALKTGRGWRHDQAQTVQQFAELERNTLAASYTLAERGDARAAAVFLGALGSLRESEVAGHLRSGLLDADGGVRSGLPAVMADLFDKLAEVEDPDTPVRVSPAPLYEQLETAVSARFRQVVQTSGLAGERVVPDHHYVQVRLIEHEGAWTLYGSWEAPGEPAVLFSDTLSPEQTAALHAVVGLADRRHAAAAGTRSDDVRASTRGWHTSKRFAALAGDDDRWRALAPSLLPPELLDMVRAVAPNAPDDQVPLVVFSPDSVLWAMPWAALTIDDAGTLLGDRAATALLPSSSLLRRDHAPRRPGTRALSYLHGVNGEGLALERAALAGSWPDSVDEAADASALVTALADPSEYSMLTMSVHGDNRPGLAHSLLLNPQQKTRLSAARMMALSFPSTVVVGACFSSSMDARVGTDPVGIPAVMLCRGASTVIGGAFPLPDGPATGHATATILGLFYALHARGARAPWALRRAQQRWRAEHDTAPHSWAGLTALTNCELD
jgi:tetratricopeptide (TPR) repeat protein